MFFQTFYQMMNPGLDYNLTLSRKDDLLTVILMPKANGLKDPGAALLVPLTMCAQPHELDQAFFTHLTQPLQKAAGVLSNMERFEKQADQAAANSKAAKAQKEQEAKDAKSKKEKFDKHMKQAGEQEAEGKLQEALTSLSQARLHATGKEARKVDEKIAELKAKQSQGSLFGAEPAGEPQKATTGQTPQQPQEQPAKTASGQEAPPAGQPAQAMPPQGQQQQPYSQVYPGQPPYGSYAPGQPGQPSQGVPAYGQPYPGGFPQGANPPQQGGYPQGRPGPTAQQPAYPDSGYCQQQPTGIPVDGGAFRAEDYAGIPDIEATHVGQMMGQQQY